MLCTVFYIDIKIRLLHCILTLGHNLEKNEKKLSVSSATSKEVTLLTENLKFSLQSTGLWFCKYAV